MHAPRLRTVGARTCGCHIRAACPVMQIDTENGCDASIRQRRRNLCGSRRCSVKLTVWPPTGAPLTPILSSVDNGWLATGLRLVQRSVPELAARAGALYDGMDFGFYYRPAVNRIAFYYRRAPASRHAAMTRSSARAGSRVTSDREGRLPPKEYYGTWPGDAVGSAEHLTIRGPALRVGEPGLGFTGSGARRGGVQRSSRWSKDAWARSGRAGRGSP